MLRIRRARALDGYTVRLTRTNGDVVERDLDRSRRSDLGRPAANGLISALTRLSQAPLADRPQRVIPLRACLGPNPYLDPYGSCLICLMRLFLVLAELG